MFSPVGKSLYCECLGLVYVHVISKTSRISSVLEGV